MFRFKLYQNLNRIFISIFLLCFIGQFIFWLQTEKVKPNVYLVPPLPSLASVKAFSFGDEQFYFRILALRIENAGDSFGRFSALRNYDYAALYKWFKILDSLDNRSIYIPTLAANYFSQTQKKEDTRYIVQYLDEFASQDIDKYWWWEVQAFYIANSTLKDYPLALKIAYKLSENKNEAAPIWTKQLPAFVEAKLGEDCTAFLFIKKMIEENETGERKIAANEIEFMRYFIKQRLDSLKKKNFNPSQCK